LRVPPKRYCIRRSKSRPLDIAFLMQPLEELRDLASLFEVGNVVLERERATY
jgi:hypothetical protein